MNEVAAVVAVVATVALVVSLMRGADTRRSLERRIEELGDAIELGAAERADAAVAIGRLERALQAIPQGVVVWDADGDEVFRNDVAAAFVGARHGEALVASAIAEQLEAALGGAPQRRDLDLFGPPQRMLVISAVGLDDGADTCGAVAVIDDVSERRRLEAVRRDFVANISHELKTPVGALGLLADTIVAEPDPTVTHRLAERMTGEAFRVARIIDDLLDLTRIEAEESPLREPVGVHSVVSEAVQRIQPLAQARSIRIDVSGVPRRHIVRGDRRQLVSAVGNLLENACKYSDDGSSVEVASKTVGAWLELAICDHGIGIPERDMERVFERFYRVDRARSRGTGGTGLGLAIVRHVANNHRGEVKVRSSEGSGSTFTLRLPTAVGFAADDEPTEGPPPTGHRVGAPAVEEQSA